MRNEITKSNGEGSNPIFEVKRVASTVMDDFTAEDGWPTTIKPIVECDRYDAQSSIWSKGVHIVRRARAVEQLFSCQIPTT